MTKITCKIWALQLWIIFELNVIEWEKRKILQIELLVLLNTPLARYMSMYLIYIKRLLNEKSHDKFFLNSKWTVMENSNALLVLMISNDINRQTHRKWIEWDIISCNEVPKIQYNNWNKKDVEQQEQYSNICTVFIFGSSRILAELRINCNTRCFGITGTAILCRLTYLKSKINGVRDKL